MCRYVSLCVIMCILDTAEFWRNKTFFGPTFPFPWSPGLSSLAALGRQLSCRSRKVKSCPSESLVPPQFHSFRGNPVRIYNLKAPLQLRLILMTIEWYFLLYARLVNVCSIVSWESTRIDPWLLLIALLDMNTGLLVWLLCLFGYLPCSFFSSWRRERQLFLLVGSRYMPWRSSLV